MVDLEPGEITELLQGAHDVLLGFPEIVCGSRDPEFFEAVGSFFPDSPSPQALYAHGLIVPILETSNWRTPFFITPEGWGVIGEYMGRKTEEMAGQIVGNFLREFGNP